jgi:hypothetical protein
VKYGSDDSLPDGIAKLQLTSVDTEQTSLAKIKVTGSGANLSLTDAGAAGLTLPVKARLVSSESDACWEGTYGVPANVKLNNGAAFKAKSN